MEENINNSLETKQNETLVGGTTKKKLKSKTKKMKTLKKTKTKKAKTLKKSKTKKAKTLKKPPKHAMKILLDPDAMEISEPNIDSYTNNKYIVYINAIIFGHGSVDMGLYDKKSNKKTKLNICGFKYTGYSNLGNAEYEIDIERYFMQSPVIDKDFTDKLSDVYHKFVNIRKKDYEAKYQRVSQLIPINKVKEEMTFVTDTKLKVFGCQLNYGAYESRKQANKIYRGKSKDDPSRHPELTTNGPLVKLLKTKYRNKDQNTEYEILDMPIIIPTFDTIRLQAIVTKIEEYILKNTKREYGLPFKKQNTQFEINILDLTCNTPEYIFTDAPPYVLPGFIEENSNV
jgi:hypothetical protein